MRIKTTYILLAAGAMLLTACVRDDIHNTDHPFEAAVTVSTDWSGRGAGVDKPTAYTVSSEGFTQKATADVQRLDKYFAPGSRSFLLYSDAAGITVADSTATVSGADAPSEQTGTYISSLPGWLMSGTATATLTADSEMTVPVAMRQQVRQLTLVIEPDGAAADEITGITASLSGIASTLDLTDGTHGTPSNVALTFTKITTGADAGKWTATVRMLGVTGAQQKLSGQVTVSGATDPVPLESDLTEALSGFNNDKTKPLTLSSEITVGETPAEAGFTATINGWKAGGGGDGTAN